MTRDRAADRLLVARDALLRGVDGARVVHDAQHTIVELHFVPAAPDVAAAKAPVPADDELRRVPLRLEGHAARGWSVLRMERARGERHVVRVVLARADDAPPPVAERVVLRLVGLANVAPGFDAVSVHLTPAAGGDEVEPAAPPPAEAGSTSADVDYLVKDYAGFRRLMLDRMAATLPAWTERHPADEGVALVELLAYAGDYLSYYQDAVATEAYLHTARLRTSVRRHARLLEYRMHEGCTPRVWLHFDVPHASMPLRARFPVTTVEDDAAGERGVSAVFLTLEATTLLAVHNTFAVYDYGRDRYTLAAGATSAALLIEAGAEPQLERGDVLIFEQAASPQTGRAEDADPRLRQAVRLRAAPERTRDALRGVDIMQIRWHDEDALAFALPVTGRVGAGETRVTGLARALGNNVPADHGEPREEDLTEVPARGAYRPRLLLGDVTFVVPYDAKAARNEPASALTDLKPYKAVPEIQLQQRFARRSGVTHRWSPARDLLAANRDARVFVVEVESDRTPVLRFGDDVHGRSPEPGSQFHAEYRIGNGLRAPLGFDSITVPMPASQEELELFETGTSRVRVRNPLPPAGGNLPQDVDDVRRAAPDAIRALRRAVVAGDYVTVARELPGVRAVAADTTFTGSWKTVRVFVQGEAGKPEDAAFLRSVRAALEPYRIVGADVAVLPPAYVTIEPELTVTIDARVEREPLRARIDEAIGALMGSESATFGQPVFASPFVSAAMSVRGVVDARVTRLARAGTAPSATPADDTPTPAPVTLGVHEIARIARCRVAFREAAVTA